MPQSDWAIVWLAVGACSLAAMAVLQVGAAIALIKAVTEARDAVRGAQKQVAPLVSDGRALIASAGVLVHHAQGVVHQAQDIALRLSTQVTRAEGAVTAAAQGVADARQTVRRVTTEATGMIAGARAAWCVIRGARRQDHRLTQ